MLYMLHKINVIHKSWPSINNSVFSEKNTPWGPCTLVRSCGGVAQLLYIIQNIDNEEILCRAFRHIHTHSPARDRNIQFKKSNFELLELQSIHIFSKFRCCGSASLWCRFGWRTRSGFGSGSYLKLYTSWKKVKRSGVDPNLPNLNQNTPKRIKFWSDRDFQHLKICTICKWPYIMSWLLEEPTCTYINNTNMATSSEL